MRWVLYIPTAIHLMILLVFFLLFCLSRKQNVKGSGSVTDLRKPDNRREAAGKSYGNRAGPFWEMAAYVYHFTTKSWTSNRIIRKCLQIIPHVDSSQLRHKIETLYPLEDEKTRQKRFAVGKLELVLIILFFGNLMAGGLSIWQLTDSKLIGENRIKKNGHGQGELEIDLRAYIDGRKEKLSLSLEEIRYTSEELDELFHEAVTILDETIAGENDSLDTVRRPLCLPTSLPGLPFHISWEFNNYQVIDSNGIPQQEFLVKEGNMVKMTAVLTSQDYRGEYIRYARLYPEEKREATQQEKLEEEIHSAEDESRYAAELELPTRLENKKILWREAMGTDSLLIIALSAAAGFLVCMDRDRQLEKLLEQRQKELKADYSEMAYKLMLLTGAGMPVRAAWQRIVRIYEKESDSGRKKNRRYVYEEMKVTLRQMESGISEQEAYDRFGKRCALTPYIKLSSLLIQNLKKGGLGLAEALEEEVRDAFRERKNFARKEGEEAGTKLLVPMAMMLAVVMVIIVVPAFMSFQF